MASVFTIGVTAMAQENPVPKFEKEGDLIKGTFYYEDGSIRQQGTYKSGRLHGKWIAYNKAGEKHSMANYTEGKKTGKWFFWNSNKLIEVDYSNNKILAVNTWKSDRSLPGQ